MQDHITFATLIITGPDAERFLQGQLTCDVTKVTTEPSFGAYCDARGRMIANFILIKNDHAFHLMLPDNILDILEHTLKKFAVFSKVTLTKNSKTRHTNIETHKLALIKKGLAFIYPETSLLFTPQMLDWEKHGGVSFTKGCYVGQEIVARTQHLGKLKRHLHKLTIADATTLVLPGTELTNSDGEVIGIVCDAAFDGKTHYALAVIQDDAVESPLYLHKNRCTVHII